MRRLLLLCSAGLLLGCPNDDPKDPTADATTQGDGQSVELQPGQVCIPGDVEACIIEGAKMAMRTTSGFGGAVGPNGAAPTSAPSAISGKAIPHPRCRMNTDRPSATTPVIANETSELSTSEG